MKKLLLHIKSFGWGAHLNFPDRENSAKSGYHLFYQMRDGLVVSHYNSLYFVAHIKLFLTFKKLLSVGIKKIPGD